MLNNPALWLIVSGALGALAACAPRDFTPTTVVPGGDPARGRVLIARIGCGACHEIPGVVGAHGLAAPPLTGIAQRTYLAGMLPNTPGNMERWLQAPQSVVPGNAMPNMEIDEHDARDMAAYLYRLR